MDALKESLLDMMLARYRRELNLGRNRLTIERRATSATSNDEIIYVLYLDTEMQLSATNIPSFTEQLEGWAAGFMAGRLENADAPTKN